MIMAMARSVLLSHCAARSAHVCCPMLAFAKTASLSTHACCGCGGRPALAAAGCGWARRDEAAAEPREPRERRLEEGVGSPFETRDIRSASALFPPTLPPTSLRCDVIPGGAEMAQKCCPSSFRNWRSLHALTPASAGLGSAAAGSAEPVHSAQPCSPCAQLRATTRTLVWPSRAFVIALIASNWSMREGCKEPGGSGDLTSNRTSTFSGKLRGKSQSTSSRNKSTSPPLGMLCL
mmetsp:Transcript_38027/g.94311  ORF Transcript_38027/g.94311 Transcript_38027/m.94311 type:complete len:235 (-) Transcript_38027:925-1629(-)